MTQIEKSVWYTTGARLKAIREGKINTAYVDQGELRPTAEGLAFKGNELSLTMTHIESVKLGRQPLPKISRTILLLTGFLFLLPCGLCFVTAVPFSFFTAVDAAENMSTVISFAACFACFGVLSLLAFGGLIAFERRATPWVQVKFQDEAGQNQVAYFSDGRLLGWLGIWGGTKSLAQTIRKVDRR